MIAAPCGGGGDEADVAGRVFDGCNWFAPATKAATMVRPAMPAAQKEAARVMRVSCP
jgi:hypothetical protein